uniref:Uncharacterized protein n=1 Tax=viral metagenome TaxID=1070528 RepID=A0A6M3JKN5_9ZZZZ
MDILSMTENYSAGDITSVETVIDLMEEEDRLLIEYAVNNLLKEFIETKQKEESIREEEDKLWNHWTNTRREK